MAEARFVGTSLARPDGPDKATGRSLYIHDLTVPGMLHGKIKFSEHPHARIVSVDLSRARRVPGVRAIVTGDDTPEIRIGFLRDNFALKRGKVRSLRDEVAAVAAESAEAAAEAIHAIRVEYEPLVGVFSLAEALEGNSPLVHETDPQGRPRSDNRVRLTYRHETGDLAAAERASDFVVEGSYATPRIQQACLGTAGCIAEFDARGNLSVTAKTQIPFLAQRDFLRALEAIGLSGRNVRVVVPALGGGFGSGLDTHAYEYIAILLAWRAGRPVKIVYSREEEFANLSPRQCAEVRVAQGCDRSGRLTFRTIEALLDNGAYTSWGATYPSVMMLPATSLYRVPVVHFDAQLVYTNNTYCQAMRGYGNPEVTFPIESNLDELAEKAGLDPLEVRRLNRNLPGETTPMGARVTTCGLEPCLDHVAKSLAWGETRGKGRARRRGVGLASLVHVAGGGRIYRSDGGGVSLRLDDYGHVHVACGGVEMGQGLHATLTAIVADELGVRPESVFLVPTDTSTCPWDVGTHASRGAFIGGNAAILAARRARDKIFAFAVDLLPAEIERNLAKWQRTHPSGAPPAFDYASAARARRFVLRDGILSFDGAPDDPRLQVELPRLLRAIHFRGDAGTLVTAEAFYEPPTELPDWEKGKGNMSATYAYGVQGAEVEVDEETGVVTILRMAAAHDVGKALNPALLAGQTYGALAQGVGYALYEEVRSERGRILNPSFTDYKIPTAVEMGFPVDLHFVEIADAEGPFGAKGVGEPGLVPTAAAIANAVYDAVGVRIRSLPITPEKILAALRERDGHPVRASAPVAVVHAPSDDRGRSCR